MFELILQAPGELVEPVCDALLAELAALSVAVEDADAGSEAEQAQFAEPGVQRAQTAWPRSRLLALFCDETAAQQAATALLAQDWHGGVEIESVHAVADRDWVRSTQSQFAPVAVTPTFWIVPSWHAVPAQAERTIRLDPGLAFGTGTHPTTRMCLRWIASHAVDAADQDRAWTRVLDYGCGSGILAIGAALHGARAVDAVDIDPQAVDATQANARANGVTVAAGPPTLAQGLYPLVVANILATPLTVLAPLLAAHLAPGGWLVLAGILERQTEALAAAYAPWLALTAADCDDGWVLLAGRRPG